MQNRGTVRRTASDKKRRGVPILHAFPQYPSVSNRPALESVVGFVDDYLLNSDLSVV